MTKKNRYDEEELEILLAYEAGQLKPVNDSAELFKLRELESNRTSPTEQDSNNQ